MRCGNGTKGLFQRLLLCNKSPQNIAAEDNHLLMLMREAMGQEVSEGPAVMWMALLQLWRIDAVSGRLLHSHVWWTEWLHVTAPCGLASSQPGGHRVVRYCTWSSGTHAYIVQQRRQKPHCLSWPTLEITRPHFHYLLLVAVVIKPTQIQGEGT